MMLSYALILLLTAVCQGCTVSLSASPNNHVFTLPDDRDELQELNVTCKLVDCSAEVEWTVDPPLQFYEVKQPFCIKFKSLGEKHAGATSYKVTCTHKTDPTKFETLHFQIKRKPFFIREGNVSLTLPVGERAIIDFEAVAGFPDEYFEVLKDGNDIKSSLDTKVIIYQGKVIIENVTRDSGGHYRFRFLNYSVARSILVTVVEENEVFATVGTSVDIAPFLDGNRTCLWETKDSGGIEPHSELYRTSEMKLQIRKISSEDVGKVFTCVAEGNLRLETTLLVRENLSVCVRDEENHRRIERVIKTTVQDDVCEGGKRCFESFMNLSYTQVADGVHHVSGDVDSTIEFVTKLYDLLGEDEDKYVTHGLTLSRGNCSGEDTAHILSNPDVDNDDDDDDTIVLVIVLVVCVMVACIITVAPMTLCYCIYRMHRNRVARVDPVHGRPGNRDSENGQLEPPPNGQVQPPPPPYSPPPAHGGQLAHQNPGLQYHDNSPRQHELPPQHVPLEAPPGNGEQRTLHNPGPPGLQYHDDAQYHGNAPRQQQSQSVGYSPPPSQPPQPHHRHSLSSPPHTSTVTTITHLTHSQPSSPTHPPPATSRTSIHQLWSSDIRPR